MEPKTFEEQCNDLRADCKRIEDACRGLKTTETATGLCCLWQMTPKEIEEARHNPKPEPISPEVAANLMLAVRHLEDARMRLGKAIQYSGNGASKYDIGGTP